MTDGTTTSHDGAFLRRCAAAIVVVLMVVLSAAAVRSSAGDNGGATGGATGGERYLHVNDLVMKADMAAELPRPPKIVILGGSRSLRFEPGYLEKKTGLPGFNAGVRNGRPEEAWGIVHYLHDLSPGTRQRYLWIVHSKVLRGFEKVSAALIYDERYERYFPQEFLDEQRKLQRPAAIRPYYSANRPARFAADGRIVWSKSDEQPLSIGIPNTVKHWNRTNGLGTPTIEERPREWFEKTLAYMNDELDAAPVLVMMPMQPDVLAEVRDNGFETSYRATRAYLRSLRGRYRFELLDFTDYRAFGGDPQNFYDGYHPRIENTRRIVDEILRRSPHAFD